MGDTGVVGAVTVVGTATVVGSSIRSLLIISIAVRAKDLEAA
jgi:hypothetical protein